MFNEREGQDLRSIDAREGIFSGGFDPVRSERLNPTGKSGA
jgi:hypothetical protein